MVTASAEEVGVSIFKYMIEDVGGDLDDCDDLLMLTSVLNSIFVDMVWSIICSTNHKHTPSPEDIKKMYVKISTKQVLSETCSLDNQGKLLIYSRN